MPRAYDAQPLPFDRDPTRSIFAMGIPKMPPIDFAALTQMAIDWFNEMVANSLDTPGWADAKAKWDHLMSQIGALFALVNSGPVSAAQWAVWWSNTLIALGYDSTSAATIANWLSGNYDAAKTAKANWDAFLTAMGLNPTQIASAIATATANWNTLLTALGMNPTQVATAIYNATANWNSFMAAWGIGTPADVAAAVAANKQKWIDLLASFGVGTPADIGAATATSKANWDAFLTAMGLNPTQIATAIQTATNNWNTFLTAMGLNPTQIAAAIAASTTNWTSFMAAWGVGTPADVAAAAADNKAKWTSFMAAWGVGTPADVATATANSKAQLAAFLASIGLGSMTAAGAQLAGNNTTLGSHTTSITTQLGWWQRLPENILISLDGMHLFYPLGSPSDTPTTTSTAYGPARRTWYACKADMALLQGQTNSTATPSVAFTDIGTLTQANTAAANTAASNASLAIATNQALNDAIVSATNGTPVTGSTPSQAQTGLENIPATNIVGQQGATVTYGAKGAGNTGSSITSGGTLAETHTTLSTDLGVLVIVDYFIPVSTVWTATVTYGGVAMSQMGRQVSGSSVASNFLCKEVWWLKSPPQNSAQTVQATFTRSSGSGTTFAMMNSFSYFASKLGTINMSTGGGTTSLSATASSAADKRVFNSFGVIAGSAPTMTAYSQTSRDSRGPTFGQSMVSGDAAGAASITFGVTCSTATNAWCACTVELSN